MPIMEVTMPEGAVPDDRRDELFDGMTTSLLKAEGAPDTEFFRNITWIHVNELPGRNVLANGRPVAEPTVKVDVTTPRGALSNRRRKILVADLTGVIGEATGIDDPLRIWILCREIDEGSWGAGGGVVEFEALKAAARQEREAEGTGTVTVS